MQALGKCEEDDRSPLEDLLECVVGKKPDKAVRLGRDIDVRVGVAKRSEVSCDAARLKRSAVNTCDDSAWWLRRVKTHLDGEQSLVDPLIRMRRSLARSDRSVQSQRSAKRSFVDIGEGARSWST